MPKVKISIKSNLKIYVGQYKVIFKTKASIILYCNVCEISVNATTKILVDRHISHVKHTNHFK